MRALLFCLLAGNLCFAHSLVAADEKSLAEGHSPNSAYELILVRDSSEPHQYRLQIRATGSQKILFTTSIGSYASFEMAAEPFNLKCLWSPDSKFVAVASRGTKRSGETAVYQIAEDTVRVVPVPDLAAIIRAQLEANIRASFVRPEVWLPEHELAVSITGTQEREENGAYRFVAFLRFPSQGPASVKSIHRDGTVDR